METLKELIERLEKKVDSLESELTQIKVTVKDKIKPVIIDIKPAKAKAIPQLNAADIEKVIKNTVTLTYVNNLYGRNK